jgi:uncharacterized protein (DUF1800 family)
MTRPARQFEDKMTIPAALSTSDAAAFAACAAAPAATARHGVYYYPAWTGPI